MLDAYPDQWLSTCRQVWAAVSGGLDSTVLLHKLVQWQARQTDPPAIHAIHIHHGQSPNAAHWQKHCRKLCQQWHIPLDTHQLPACPPGANFEAWAHEQRELIFASLLTQKQPSAVVLAQHQDDQAETFMLNALRGCGPQGLAAMPQRRPCGPGMLLRPLLNYTRTDLYAYACHHGLHWIEDESNADTTYRRNFLRHDVIPGLYRHWPRATATLAHTARQCGRQQQVLEEYLDTDIARITVSNHPGTLNYHQLINITDNRRLLLLRRWLIQQGCKPLPARQLEALHTSLIHAASGWQVVLGRHTLRRYRSFLELVSNGEQTAPAAAFCYHWPARAPGLFLPEQALTITREALITFGLSETLIDSGKLYLRSRQPGDRCRYPGRQHRNTLKILFQELDIPVWQRQQTVIITRQAAKSSDKETIIAVWPFFICPR